MSILGRWIFAGPKGLWDETGKWKVVKLFGEAQLTFGGLQLRPGGYAHTTPKDGVSFSITEKTLISWVVIEDLDDARPAGSALTLGSRGTEQFDAIVFGELADAAWTVGNKSLEKVKMGPENPIERESGQLLKMALTCRAMGDAFEIALYRNDVLVQSFHGNGLETWKENEVDVLFGARRVLGAEVQGHMHATIVGAEIHDVCLGIKELEARKLPERDVSATIPDPMVGVRIRNKTRSTIYVQIIDVLDGCTLAIFSVKGGEVYASSLDFPPPMPASRPRGMPLGPSARVIVAADSEMRQQLGILRLDWSAPRIYSVVFESTNEGDAGHRLVAKG